MYNEIREQIPNPYYPNELYPIFSSNFSPKSKYYACINTKGFLHIYKFTVGRKKLLLERFRFTKEKKLVIMGDFVLTEKDGDVYTKYMRLLEENQRYVIEKHYRYTNEVKKFIAITKSEARRIFYNFFHGAKTDMYDYSREKCFNLGHASFTDFYIVVIREN